MPSFLITFAGLLFALLLIPTTAHAYLDPGAGSLLLQVLLAGIAGLSVVIKLYWRRFLALFRRSGTT